MGRGADERAGLATARRGGRKQEQKNVHRLGEKMVIEMQSASKLQEAKERAQEMEKLAHSQGLDLKIDPLTAAAIPEEDPKRALAWYIGDRSLLLSPEEVAPGMSAAAEMLSETIDSGEKIAVYCDYDVDGITAGEILRNTLLSYGAEPIMGYTRLRDGFGLSEDFVRQAHGAGCSTLVTVDTGSGSEEAVLLAKELGMKVIVTDHHSTKGHEDNAADFHLNPDLQDPPSATATGAQVAWYFAAALQEARDGSINEEHYKENMYLAGLGCVADWGDHTDGANRPFLVARDAPPGVAALLLDRKEDVALGETIKTRALINLPKRTDAVSGQEVASLLRAKNAEEAAPIIARIKEGKKRQDTVTRAMKQELEDTYPTASSGAKGSRRIQYHIFEDPDALGAAGTVAQTFANKMDTPAFIFAKQKDVNGQEIYKFSGRVPSRGAQAIGELSADEGVIAVLGENQAGGHAQVFSGTCKKEDIPALVEAMEKWAGEQKSFYPESKEAKSEESPIFVDERNLDPSRLAAVEESIEHLAPYSYNDRHFAPKVSVRGTLSERQQKGRSATIKLTTADGETRLVAIGEDRGPDGKRKKLDLPEGEEIEVFLEYRPGATAIIRHAA